MTQTVEISYFKPSKSLNGSNERIKMLYFLNRCHFVVCGEWPPKTCKAHSSDCGPLSRIPELHICSTDYLCMCARIRIYIIKHLKRGDCHEFTSEIGSGPGGRPFQSLSLRMAPLWFAQTDWQRKRFTTIAVAWIIMIISIHEISRYLCPECSWIRCDFYWVILKIGQKLDRVVVSWSSESIRLTIA